jgi:hypothetical protein
MKEKDSKRPNETQSVQILEAGKRDFIGFVPIQRND